MSYIAIINNKEYKIDVEEKGKNIFSFTIGNKNYSIDAVHSEHSLYSLIINGKSYEVDLDARDGVCNVLIKGEHYCINVINEKKKSLVAKAKEFAAEGKQQITTEMPGKVARILVGKGQQVKRNQGVIVVEAMKMENELKTPKDGKVVEINVKEGETVEGGTVLLVIE